LTRSDTRILVLPGTSKKVATHPVAQLSNEDIPVANLLQGTHRSLSPRTHSFHTTYDSFGNQSNTSFTSRYQYTGREYDSVTGIYYYRARWYDSKVGRFVSEDPIGFVGGDVNLYGYVWNSPSNWTDPEGLYPFRLPANPSQLPPTWTPDPSHKNPNGSRWTSPSGDSKIEFEPGRSGETGWKAKDHWHKWVPDPKRPGKWVKDKEHREPGDEIEVERAWCPVSVPQYGPSMFELRMQIEAAEHMERFWGTILAGAAVAGGVVIAWPGAVAAAPVLVPQIPRLTPAYGF
jgi:RHS repeat-associated protein